MNGGQSEADLARWQLALDEQRAQLRSDPVGTIEMAWVYPDGYDAEGNYYWGCAADYEYEAWDEALCESEEWITTEDAHYHRDHPLLALTKSEPSSDTKYVCGVLDNEARQARCPRFCHRCRLRQCEAPLGWKHRGHRCLECKGKKDNGGDVVQVCGLHAQANPDEWIVVDSGSQAFACRPDFACEFGLDDTSKASMIDIQGNAIPGAGKRVVDIEMKDSRGSIQTRVAWDVANQGLKHNVAPVTELVESGFGVHFTPKGHWLERDGENIEMVEMPTSAPDAAVARHLYAFRAKVMQPKPDRDLQCIGALRTEGPPPSDSSFKIDQWVELTGLEKNQELNGVLGQLKAYNPASKRWKFCWQERLAHGKLKEQFVFAREMNLAPVEEADEDIDRPWPLASTDPTVLREPPAKPTPEQIKKHNATHYPFEAWCDICVASKGQSDHHKATERAEGAHPTLQLDYTYVSADGAMLGDKEQAKACLLDVVETDTGSIGAVVPEFPIAPPLLPAGVPVPSVIRTEVVGAMPGMEVGWLVIGPDEGMTTVSNFADLWFCNND